MLVENIIAVVVGIPLFFLAFCAVGAVVLLALLSAGGALEDHE